MSQSSLAAVPTADAAGVDFAAQAAAAVQQFELSRCVSRRPMPCVRRQPGS